MFRSVFLDIVFFLMGLYCEYGQYPFYLFLKQMEKNPTATGNSYSASSSTENSNAKLSDNVPTLSDMSSSDFNLLTEQLNLMIDAMFKATTMTEAVQVGVKFTNQIVIGLRFSNGFK